MTHRYISSSGKGWDLETISKLDEPIVDRHTEVLGHPAKKRKNTLGPSFFTLSGGILRREHRTSNRIDSMLSRMIETSQDESFSPHVDKNLDYLHTSLQLDMISMVALEFRPLDDEDLLDREGI
ncbi:MAG: hypothetical protein KKE24_09035 [Candidatus Thermoplasmatota archaeon]|nr:hypothetical protein [Candidatus Thermoplasmatota archaeon]